MDHDSADGEVPKAEGGPPLTKIPTRCYSLRASEYLYALELDIAHEGLFQQDLAVEIKHHNVCGQAHPPKYHSFCFWGNACGGGLRHTSGDLALVLLRLERDHFILTEGQELEGGESVGRPVFSNRGDLDIFKLLIQRYQRI